MCHFTRALSLSINADTHVERASAVVCAGIWRWARARGRRDKHRKANIPIPFNKFVVQCQGQQQIDSESERHDFHPKRFRAQHLAGVKSTSMFQSKVPLSSHVMPRNFFVITIEQMTTAKWNWKHTHSEWRKKRIRKNNKAIDRWMIAFSPLHFIGWREQPNCESTQINTCSANEDLCTVV